MQYFRTMQVAFYQSESEQPHPGRARAIIKAHPEVRELMVRNPWTALIAVWILMMQTAIAFGMGQLGFRLLVGQSADRLLRWRVRQSCELRHHSRCHAQPDFPEAELEQNGGHHRRSSQSHTRRDGFSCLSFEASFASGRLRIRRRPGEPLGGTTRGQQMVSQGDLAHALSVFSTDPAATIESDQDVGPLVLP